MQLYTYFPVVLKKNSFSCIGLDELFNAAGSLSPLAFLLSSFFSFWWIIRRKNAVTNWWWLWSFLSIHFIQTKLKQNQEAKEATFLTFLRISVLHSCLLPDFPGLFQSVSHRSLLEMLSCSRLMTGWMHYGSSHALKWYSQKWGGNSCTQK